MKKLLFLLLLIPVTLFSQTQEERYNYFLEKGKANLKDAYSSNNIAFGYFEKAYQADSTKAEIKMYYGLAKMDNAINYYRLRDKFYPMWQQAIRLVNESKEDKNLALKSGIGLVNNYAILLPGYRGGLCNYYSKNEVQAFFDAAFEEIKNVRNNPKYEGGMGNAEATIKKEYDIFRFEEKCDKVFN